MYQMRVTQGCTLKTEAKHSFETLTPLHQLHGITSKNNLDPSGNKGKTKVTIFSKMLVRMYQSVRRHIPEDRHLNSSALNMEAANHIFRYITYTNRQTNIDHTFVC